MRHKLGLLAGVAVLCLAFMATPASAQLVKPGSYKPLGYCQLTGISSATSLTSCSGGIPTGANTIEVCIEAQAVRYRDDGVAPTASVGMPMPSASCFPYSIAPLSNIQFIQQTSGAIVNVSFYQ